jgi:uncharacterized ion transporter superfamily protein YfcC
LPSKANQMKKRTAYLIIGIGSLSILTGIYKVVRSGEWLDSLFGVFIGLSLIVAVVYERNRQDKKDEDH